MQFYIWVLAQQHAALKQLPADSKYCKRDCFSRHQFCSEEDTEDSFAVDIFVLQLTSNIDSEEKVKIYILFWFHEIFNQGM